ncbi:MAG: hypothetical protein Q9219_002715 [cf. Caloplaca sp. 3 TL-2023]
MVNGIPFYPFFYSTVEHEHDVVEHVQDLTYIPDIFPIAQANPLGERKQSPKPLPSAQERSLVDEELAVSLTPLDKPYQPSNVDTTSLEQTRDSCTNPELTRNQAVGSDIGFVCGAGDAEGDIRIRRTNLERLSEADCWAHSGDVGFGYSPKLEGNFGGSDASLGYQPSASCISFEWQCYDSDNKFVNWDNNERERHSQDKAVHEVKVKGFQYSDTGSTPTLPNGNYAHTSQSSVHEPLGRNTWNSGGDGIRAGPDDYLLASESMGGVLRSRAAQGNRKPLTRHEFTQEAGEPLGVLRTEEPRLERRRTAQGIHDEDEKALIVRFLKEEISAGNLTEHKWQVISQKLAEHDIKRSQWSIKAWWSRKGRLQTGFDERQNPGGRKLVTSKQDPRDRKRARERKKAGLEQGRAKDIQRKTKQSYESH